MRYTKFISVSLNSEDMAKLDLLGPPEMPDYWHTRTRPGRLRHLIETLWDKQNPKDQRPKKLTTLIKQLNTRT